MIHNDDQNMSLLGSTFLSLIRTIFESLSSSQLTFSHDC